MEEANLGPELGLNNQVLLPSMSMAPTPSTTTHQVQRQSQAADAGVNHLSDVNPLVKTRVEHFERISRQNPCAKMQHKTASHNVHDVQCTCTCSECQLTQVIEHRLSSVVVAAVETGMQELGRLVTAQHNDIYGRVNCNREEIKCFQEQVLNWIDQHLVPRLETLEKKLPELLTKRLDGTQPVVESQQDHHAMEVILRELGIIKSEVLELKSTDSWTSPQWSDCELPGHQKGAVEKPPGVFNRLKSFISPSQPEEALMKLKLENECLRRGMEQIRSCHEKEVLKLQKELQAMKDKNQRLTGAVMELKRQTEGDWKSSETPRSVARSFEKLFSTTRCNSGDVFLKSPSGRELANDIFKVAYEECHTAVLKELFKELFFHHEEGNDMTIAEDQKRIYGKLLFLKKQPLQVILHDRLAMLTSQVLTKAQGNMDNTKDVKTDTKYTFAQAAVNTALNMIAMQPPMVIDYPQKFLSDSIQRKQSEDWDEHLEMSGREYTLRYFRPVLYSNCGEQEVSKPAYVGNKPSCD